MSIIDQSYRYHDFSYGHRVFGHENKCAVLHGHNGRVHFYCQGDKDDIGRVIDFGEINLSLCQWVEKNWDHRFLVFEEDLWYPKLRSIDPTVLALPFNPTAENMASFLLTEVGPYQLAGKGATLVKVIMDETRKCSGIATLT